jgi:hypothetical protein
MECAKIRKYYYNPQQSNYVINKSQICLNKHKFVTFVLLSAVKFDYQRYVLIDFEILNLLVLLQAGYLDRI